jgi:ABC-type transport system involved in cytochrome bd biosynthesis fused ATPase/permease subunit
MNKRSNKKMHDSVGIWITEEPTVVSDNQHMVQESLEQSIFLCEEDISDEELMSMIAGQRYI